MTEQVDVVVVGAGVVGLACARAMALVGRDVLVLEQHGLIGSETSSRNSEVIHAGIYYPTGSLKASLCVAGNRRLYDYCAEHHLAHRQCGKIIVAVEPEQTEVLRGYQQQSLANGVAPLAWLERSQIAELEPEVKAVAGLLSATTGIIDSHAYMLSLQGELEAGGGMIALGSKVQSIEVGSAGIVVSTDEMRLNAQAVINCAGLSAPGLARQIDASVPPGRFARGHYFSYSGRAPFSRLVYPVAEPGGLGVHVTVDMAGQVKFGPDVQWCETADYRFDQSRISAFETAVRRYFPELDASRLQPDFVGVRPKISAPGEPAADFRIDGPQEHGVAGLVNLLGIESPGLTASLAIADYVLGKLDRGLK